MDKYNLRNPAVKRIVQELKEIQRDDNPDVVAEANEDNIFEWNFAIRGAWDTEFEGGIYHGRIIMPADYPFKPPAFVMLTPSGRFETNVKICLSISSHHPESWQPSWSVRSALVALIAFMQSPGQGALGSLDQPMEVRQQMAAASRQKPPASGNGARQKIIDDMHQRMLELEECSRQLYSRITSADGVSADAATSAGSELQVPGDLVSQQEVGEESEGDDFATKAVVEQDALETAQQAQHEKFASGTVPASADVAPADVAEGEEGLRQRRGAGAGAAFPTYTSAPSVEAHQPFLATTTVPQVQLAAQQVLHQHQQAAAFEDRLLTWLAIFLVAGILALVCRRLFGAVGVLGEGRGERSTAPWDSQL